MTDWLIFTSAQVTNARALNDAARRLEPRLIDNPAHAQFGKFTLPTDILSAKGFERFNARIDKLPKVTAEPDDLFLPQKD